MSTKTTSRETGTFLLVLSPLLAIGSVVLAVVAAQVSYGVTRQRESTCNGRIPMPTSAFALGWAAVGVALLATVVVLLGQRSRDRVLSSGLLYDAGRVLLMVSAAVAVLVGVATGALLLAGAGGIAFVGAGVLVTARRRYRHPGSATSGTQRPGAPRALFMVLLTAAVVSLLFDGYGLATIYQDAPTKAHVCSG